MESSEVFSMLGFPARLAGRVPVVGRYLWVALSAPKTLFATNSYAQKRWPTYNFRPWLWLDAAELEQIERLINDGSNEEVLEFCRAQLASGAMTTVVVSQINDGSAVKPLPMYVVSDVAQGSLLAAVGATMLTLDGLSDVNLTIRSIFTISVMLSLMSVYFTLIQQRELSLPTSAETLRDWLCDGWTEEITSPHDVESGQGRLSKPYRRSSLSSNILLQAPFELLSIAISLFLSALAAYQGLAMREHVRLGTGRSPDNETVLIPFCICTLFALMVFGQALGQKDREKERCKQAAKLSGMVAPPSQQP